MAKLRQSGEDYLETILMLSKKGGVRYIDIANEISVSKPSVSCADSFEKLKNHIENYHNS